MEANNNQLGYVAYGKYGTRDQWLKKNKQKENQGNEKVLEKVPTISNLKDTEKSESEELLASDSQIITRPLIVKKDAKKNDLIKPYLDKPYLEASLGQFLEINDVDRRKLNENGFSNEVIISYQKFIRLSLEGNTFVKLAENSAGFVSQWLDLLKKKPQFCTEFIWGQAINVMIGSAIPLENKASTNAQQEELKQFYDRYRTYRTGRLEGWDSIETKEPSRKKLLKLIGNAGFDSEYRRTEPGKGNNGKEPKMLLDAYAWIPDVNNGQNGYGRKCIAVAHAELELKKKIMELCASKEKYAIALDALIEKSMNLSLKYFLMEIRFELKMKEWGIEYVYADEKQKFTPPIYSLIKDLSLNDLETKIKHANRQSLKVSNGVGFAVITGSTFMFKEDVEKVAAGVADFSPAQVKKDRCEDACYLLKNSKTKDACFAVADGLGNHGPDSQRISTYAGFATQELARKFASMPLPKMSDDHKELEDMIIPLVDWFHAVSLEKTLEKLDQNMLATTYQTYASAAVCRITPIDGKNFRVTGFNIGDGMVFAVNPTSFEVEMLASSTQIARQGGFHHGPEAIGLTSKHPVIFDIILPNRTVVNASTDGFVDPLAILNMIQKEQDGDISMRNIDSKAMEVKLREALSTGYTGSTSNRLAVISKNLGAKGWAKAQMDYLKLDQHTGASDPGVGDDFTSMFYQLGE